MQTVKNEKIREGKKKKRGGHIEGPCNCPQGQVPVTSKAGSARGFGMFRLGIMGVVGFRGLGV